MKDDCLAVMLVEYLAADLDVLLVEMKVVLRVV